MTCGVAGATCVGGSGLLRQGQCGGMLQSGRCPGCYKVADDGIMVISITTTRHHHDAKVASYEWVACANPPANKL